MLVWSWRRTRCERCGAVGNLQSWAWSLCLVLGKAWLSQSKTCLCGDFLPAWVQNPCSFSPRFDGDLHHLEHRGNHQLPLSLLGLNPWVLLLPLEREVAGNAVGSDHFHLVKGPSAKQQWRGSIWREQKSAQGGWWGAVNVGSPRTADSSMWTWAGRCGL